MFNRRPDNLWNNMLPYFLLDKIFNEMGGTKKNPKRSTLYLNLNEDHFPSDALTSMSVSWLLYPAISVSREYSLSILTLPSFTTTTHILWISDSYTKRPAHLQCRMKADAQRLLCVTKPQKALTLNTQMSYTYRYKYYNNTYCDI